MSDPAAKLIKMTVHAFSDSALCVGISNPDPSNIWATKVDEVWNEHGCVETLNLMAREVQFTWHVHAGVSTLPIKKQFSAVFERGKSRVL